MFGNHDKEIEKRLERIECSIERLREGIHIIGQMVASLLPKVKAKSATLLLGGSQMPLSVHINDKPGIATLVEWDAPNGTGNKVPPVGAVSYASDNVAVATVDPASGQLAYVGAGTCNISGTDAGNSLTASDSLTVSAAVAVSATMVLTPGK